MVKKYRLLKDLPGVKAGTKYLNHKRHANRWYPENEFEDGELTKENSALHGLTTAMVEDTFWFEEVKPERITVDVHSVSWVEDKAEKVIVVTNPSRLIQTELFPAIKTAIENVLNGTSTLFDCNQELMEQISKMYTEKDLEDAFSAGRIIWPFSMREQSYVSTMPQYEFPKFADYLSTLNKQSPCK